MAMPAKTTSDDDDSNNLNEGTKIPHKKVIIFETPVRYHRAKVHWVVLLVCRSWCKVIWLIREVILFLQREKRFKHG